MSNLTLSACKKRQVISIIDGEIIPIEVKSGQVVKAQSLQTFCEKYKPAYRIILSAKPSYSSHGMARYYPLYLAGLL